MRTTRGRAIGPARPDQPTPRQRGPEAVRRPGGFLEAWGTKAQKPHFVRKRVVLALPKNNYFIEICDCFTLAPQASKKQMARKPLRGPFDSGESNGTAETNVKVI